MFLVGLDGDFQVVLTKYVAYLFLGDFRLSCGAVAGLCIVPRLFLGVVIETGCIGRPFHWSQPN